jgi:hypothetical protein
MHLDDVIPKPKPRPRKDETGNNENIIPFESPGPWRGRILRFTGPFFERNDSTTSTPYYRKCEADHPKAIARIRVHVEFDELKARSGAPLVLSAKYRASREATATLTLLVAGLANLTVEEVKTKNLDLNDFIGRRVDATLQADRDGFARIASITPLGSAAAARAGT